MVSRSRNPHWIPLRMAAVGSPRASATARKRFGRRAEPPPSENDFWWWVLAVGQGEPTGAIRKGNEWVLRARLTDARFFWEEDRRLPLAQHSAKLSRVTFHEKLGSYALKCERMIALASAVREAFERSGAAVTGEAVEESVRLCKADLTTQMVKEFPELEGIVGGLYARADGCLESVALAIYAHYLPRGLEDPLPPTPEGAIVGLLDRLDTQAGIVLLSSHAS